MKTLDRSGYKGARRTSRGTFASQTLRLVVIQLACLPQTLRLVVIQLACLPQTLRLVVIQPACLHVCFEKKKNN